MALDIAKAKEALIKERERLVHQLDELGAAETGDLRADYDFGGSFADAAAVTAEHGACRVLTNLGRYQDSKHLHFHVNSGTPLRPDA